MSLDNARVPGGGSVHRRRDIVPQLQALDLEIQTDLEFIYGRSPRSRRRAGGAGGDVRSLRSSVDSTLSPSAAFRPDPAVRKASVRTGSCFGSYRASSSGFSRTFCRVEVHDKRVFLRKAANGSAKRGGGRYPRAASGGRGEAASRSAKRRIEDNARVPDPESAVPERPVPRAHPGPKPVLSEQHLNRGGA
jgi:hypothetical protein